MSSRLPGSDRRRFTERLTTYRPALDRTVFGLALLGLATSAHIAIQQQRGFDQGCTGFSSSLFAGPMFDCGTVTSSAASIFLGMSNSIWGLLFYVSVAALTAGAAWATVHRRSQLKSARTVLVAGGFLYSMYLVYYQFFILDQLCALCLLSASIVTTMGVLHIVDLRRPARHAPVHSESAAPSTATSSTMSFKLSREITILGTLAVLLIVVVGADILYFDSLEAPDVFAAEEGPSPEAALQTRATDSQPVSLPAECGYDLEMGRVEDYGRLVNFFDPTIGDPVADVTVIEYFDPNCPHCKTMHEVMMPVVRSHSDQARFVFKPFVLWRHSVAQSEALYAAAQEGKFFEMLDAQFAVQNPQAGIPPEQLRAMAERIGMNGATLMQRLESGIYQSTLAQEKQKAVDIGVTSTPTVLINGRFVAPTSRTEECLGSMIEDAARG